MSEEPPDVLESEKPDLPPELADLLARMALPSSPMGAYELAEGHLSAISAWKRLQSIAIIGGMLTDLRFHPHVIRLDWLQRLVVAHAIGKKKPKRRDLVEILHEGMRAARISFLEDDIEGFFVDSVPTSRMDALIFEGHWEGAAQHTTTVLRAFEALSDAPIKQDALDGAYALLRLSTELVRRSGLDRRCFERGRPKGNLPLPSDDGLQKLARRVKFSKSELEQLGISNAVLRDFLLPEPYLEHADRDSPGSGVTDRYPLLEVGDGLVVMNPGSLSLAVRSLLLETVVRGGVDRAFVAYLADSQADYAASTGFFPTQDMRFTALSEQGLRAMLMRFAPGKYLHVIQVLPDVAAFLDVGFGGIVPLHAGANEAIGAEVSRFWNFLGRAEDAREGTTVLLMGGWGGTIHILPHINEIDAPDNWQFIPISFADAATMGACRDGKLRDVRRMFQQLSIISDAGYEVSQINGTINTFGNWRRTNGNFVPEHWDAGKPGNIMLPIDDLFEVRLEGEGNRDLRAVPRRDGTFETVQRAEWSDFSANKPIYGSIEAISQGRLTGVVNMRNRTWWVSAALEDEDNGSREWQYQVWNAAIQWLGASAERLIEKFPTQFPQSAGEVRIAIIGNGSSGFELENPDGAPADHLCLRIGRDGVHEVVVQKTWMHFLRRADNSAERALACAIAVQLSASLGCQISARDAEESIRNAVPSDNWRYLHAQRVKHPMDRIAAGGFYLRFRRIPRSAAALVRCGSIWRFWERENGVEFSGEAACRDFLNAYYDFVLGELIQHIRCFSREKLTIAAAERYASARKENDQWRRTILAMRTIHGSSIDEDALIRFSEFNAVQRAAKAVCEIAACEASTESAAAPSQDDLDEMFARTLLLFGNGQLYATIRGGLVRPRLKISPAGDLLSDRSIFEKTFLPSSKRANVKTLDESAQSYAKRFEEPEEARSGDLSWSDEFKAAVSSEYKCSPEAVVDLQMVIIQSCEAAGSGILIMRRSELANLLTSNANFPDGNVDGLLSRMTLPRRDDWNALPATHTGRDLELWRFDRKYSLINRPLLALTSDDDPMLLVSPVFVSDGTFYQLSAMHTAAVHNDNFWDSKEARAYAGKRADEIGTEFENEVAAHLNAVGFDAQPRQKVTSLLREGTGENLGDVDVFVIHPSRSHVFVLEAKSLKLCRTEAEVAARMTEYAGKMKIDKGREKPDKLLRHLRRVTYLREKAELLGKNLGLPQKPLVHGLMVVDAPQPMNFFMLEQHSDAHSCIVDDLLETIEQLLSVSGAT